MSPSGRHAKSKARLSAYDKMMNEDAKQQEEKLEIFIPNGPRLGDVVIEAHDVKRRSAIACFTNISISRCPLLVSLVSSAPTERVKRPFSG